MVGFTWLPEDFTNCPSNPLPGTFASPTFSPFVSVFPKATIRMEVGRLRRLGGGGRARGEGLERGGCRGVGGGGGAKGAFWFPKVNKRPSYHQYKTVPTDPSGWMCWGVRGWWGGGGGEAWSSRGVGGCGGTRGGGVGGGGGGGGAGCSRKYQQYVTVCQVASGIKNNCSHRRAIAMLTVC